MKVCKFGGTSMANAQTIERVANIINSDDERRFVVVSAPGKRDKGDTKVTDLLYECADELEKSGDCSQGFAKVEQRFLAICNELNLDFDMAGLLAKTKADILKIRTREFIASRGEYLVAQVLANKIGAEFIDAAEAAVIFDEDGNLMLDDTIEKMSARLDGVQRAVIPGFYGIDVNGNIRTFSRGGSDVSGAIVARAAEADVYENWTDVDGFLSADPHIVENPELIDYLSYRELRELSYMGADVLHPESIFPVRSVGIPINIRNTFNPEFKGTMIVAPGKVPPTDKVITGIAGRKGFTIINIEKDMMNSEIGFGRKVLAVLEEESISFEHVPSGIDTLSVVIRDEFINGKMQEVLGKLQASINGDSIEILSGLSLIATVGHNMMSRLGTAATLFKALADNRINIHMIDQGSSELNIIVGVASKDYEKAINAIYHAFVK